MPEETMADAPSSVLDAKISRKPGRISLVVFIGVLLGGVIYAGGSLLSDLSPLRSTPSSVSSSCCLG